MFNDRPMLVLKFLDVSLGFDELCSKLISLIHIELRGERTLRTIKVGKLGYNSGKLIPLNLRVVLGKLRRD